jgi:hypothetical protein
MPNRYQRLSLVLVIFFTGCVSTSFTRTGEEYPAFVGVVQVFFEVPEAVEYAQVGILSAKGYSQHDLTDIIAALQKAAAKKGANAVVIIGSDRSRGAVLSSGEYGTFASTTDNKTVTAMAIRIRG